MILVAFAIGILLYFVLMVLTILCHRLDHPAVRLNTQVQSISKSK